MTIHDNTRYDKQIKVSYIGQEAQQKLMNSHVAIVGLGALGSTVAEQLTRSGIGSLTLIDRDYVELGNLQRQQLYTEQDVAAHLPKAIAAFTRLSSINSSIQLHPVITHLDAKNIEKCLHQADIIIDATDNLTVRYLINEYAMEHGKVWIHGAVASTYGRVASFQLGQQPCFECIYPNSPELDGIDTCDTVGVLNSIVTIIGSMQATECIKWLIGHDVKASMLQFDVWNQHMLTIDLAHAKNKHCPVCVQKQFNRLHKQLEEQVNSLLCGRNTVQIYYPKLNPSSFEHYIERFKDRSNRLRNKYLCKFDYEGCTITFFPDGRCLVQGTDDIEFAEQLIAKLFDF